MVGENQPRDQPSKLEGCVWGGEAWVEAAA